MTDEHVTVAEYLTVQQVAGMLQISTRTVQRLVDGEPTLPALKLGGVLRFPRERLVRWLRDREAGAPRSRKLKHGPDNPASARLDSAG
jgi:excisionase family DNA binding protein